MNFDLNVKQNKYADPVTIQVILEKTKTIAVVGLSPKTERPSHNISAIMQAHGYRIIPINPQADEILGEIAYPDLKSAAANHTIELVNVFRRSEECPSIAVDAVAIGAESIWLQLGVINYEAAELAESGGLQVIMDRCLKIEHNRYR